MVLGRVAVRPELLQLDSAAQERSPAGFAAPGLNTSAHFTVQFSKTGMTAASWRSAEVKLTH